MDITINKTFYTYSTKSLLLRYKENFQKAIKLGSFLQCSAHVFLRSDEDFWKINLKILWNHVRKNFQVRHGQCDSIISPKIILTKSYIHKFIIEIHVLLCLLVQIS